MQDILHCLVEIRKGALGRGHYHDIETVQIVVKGRIRFELDPVTKKQSEVVAVPMKVFEIPQVWQIWKKFRLGR